MNHHYEFTIETTEGTPELSRALLYIFDTLEDAIERADALKATTIYEIGGSWDEYMKCWFCGEWFPVSELNFENSTTDEGLCNQCKIATIQHGG